MSPDPTRHLVAHYERCLKDHGDHHRGVDWPDAADAQSRYRVMLALMPNDDAPKTLLDFGCGLGHLYDEIVRIGRHDIRYCGVDASLEFVRAAAQRHPDQRFECIGRSDEPPKADYVVMNGVFTEKRSLSFEVMYAHCLDTLERVWRSTCVGLAFNVMSTVVDWERDDLFHVPMGRIVADVAKRLSRHVVVRHDYGLYEYTLYVYRKPRR